VWCVLCVCGVWWVCVSVCVFALSVCCVVFVGCVFGFGLFVCVWFVCVCGVCVCGACVCVWV